MYLSINLFTSEISCIVGWGTIQGTNNQFIGLTKSLVIFEGQWSVLNCSIDTFLQFSPAKYGQENPFTS